MSLTRVLCAGLFALVSAVPVQAAQHSVPATPFDKAQRLREALDGRPESHRTRRDYDHVLDAYRAIYHANPAASKADASISAVGELLSEEGRIFDDEKALRDAIGQFEFLRREYPTSHLRQSALFTEGEIERRDLGDRTAARKSFEQFLKLYPQHSLAEQARTELKAIQKEELAEKRKGKKTAAPAKAQTENTEPARPAATIAKLSPNPTSLVEKKQPKNKLTESDLPPTAPEAIGSTAPASSPAPAYLSAQPSSSAPAPTRNPDRSMVGSTQNEPSLDANPPIHKGRMPLVTGIRHWSTNTYTRIAIDLEAEVHYEAARVLNPDRIYFDLLGTRLAPELIGKSFDVTDEGYLRRIRIAQFQGDRTRVVLDVSDVSDYSAFLLPNPWRLIIDIHGGRPVQTVAQTPAPSLTRPEFSATPAPAKIQPLPIQPQQQTSASSAREVASISHQPSRVSATVSPTTAPIAAMVAAPASPAPDQPDTSKSGKKNRKNSKHSSGSNAAPDAVQAAAPTANGQRSLVRALGLKVSRIVIDAGHGGHDSGTLGPDGIQEKEVVLDVALRLGKLLHQRLGAEIIYTRDDDTFIPLETRTAIANKAQADLFLSVHANSSSDSSARGVEVYYLNFTSSPDALEVAARENAVGNQSIHQLSDLVKKITLKDKIDESREFATDVDQSLYAGLQQGNRGLRDRGVKKAPFVVLIGANMPSILAEISFLTNPDDAHKLQTGDYRQRIAESIERGVEQYYRSLASVHPAESKGR